MANVAVDFNLMAVEGIMRALDIIDGFNGLAGALAIMVLCACPVVASLFVIYQRIVATQRHLSLADAVHLRHLVAKHLVREQIGLPLSGPRARHNPETSPNLWLIAAMAVSPAVLFWNRTHPLMRGAPRAWALYVFGYARLTRFRLPGWPIVRPGRAAGLE